MKPLPWKVGELARRTGLSVRALHHYDEIGLLRPSLRTPAGHRLYERDDLARLQQIQSLRAVGFPLEEIGRILTDPAVSSQRVVQLHLDRLRQQIALQTRLVERLKRLAHHLESAETVSADELCQMIEETTIMEKYFTTEQLEEIRQRGEQIGPERIRAVEGEWAEILPAVRRAMESGTDPASPEVQELARRWQGLVHEFTGGNREIAESVRAVYQHEGPALQNRYGNVPDPAMFEYMAKAFAVGKK
ncbi:MAG TPA: MerR family transcriptional regulator [Thermoanaerobaculia bacterium]|nr:MerR family transcriptional regulator [Thermoanaerobaculia bacterium]